MNFKIPFHACNGKHFLKIAFQLVKMQKIIFQLKAFKTLYFFSNSCSNLKKKNLLGKVLRGNYENQ